MGVAGTIAGRCVPNGVVERSSAEMPARKGKGKKSAPKNPPKDREEELAEQARNLARDHGATDRNISEKEGSESAKKASDAISQKPLLPTPKEPVAIPEPKQPSSESSRTNERQHALGKVFHQFDLDDSGEIETKELLALGQARRKLGQKSGAWTEEKNAKLVKNMDTDGDGTVNEKEFSGYFDKSLTKDEAEFEETVAQFMEVAKECRQQKQEKRAAGKKEAAETADGKAAEEAGDNLAAQAREVSRKHNATDKNISETADEKPISKKAAKAQRRKSQDQAKSKAAAEVEGDDDFNMSSAAAATATADANKAADEEKAAAKKGAARQKSLAKVFQQFDLDDSGEIETKELLALGQARRKLGQKSGAWTEEKNAKLVKNMDTDGDGTVNEKEFSGYFDKSLTKDEA